MLAVAAAAVQFRASSARLQVCEPQVAYVYHYPVVGVFFVCSAAVAARVYLYFPFLGVRRVKSHKSSCEAEWGIKWGNRSCWHGFVSTPLWRASRGMKTLSCSSLVQHNAIPFPKMRTATQLHSCRSRLAGTDSRLQSGNNFFSEQKYSWREISQEDRPRLEIRVVTRDEDIFIWMERHAPPK